MSIAIREKDSDTLLARGEEGRQALKYEGNWYFDPSVVDQSTLVVTDRTYTCPMKGTALWIDFVDINGRTVKDVAWVYNKPKPGHEAIAGRYGFYAGSRGGTKQES